MADVEYEWGVVKNELFRRIREELAAKPEEERCLFYLEGSDGDMSEFPTMLCVIDRILGADEWNWEYILRSLEKDFR